MTIDEILVSTAAGECHFPEGWAQGRAGFGGLVAAMMFQALQARITDRPVRAISVSFVGPVQAGPVALEVTVFREGRSVTQAQCRLEQQGQVLAVMLASFGKGRESAIRVAGPSAPTLAGPEQGQALPEVPGLTPEFVRHFDFRWCEGPYPYTGGEQGVIGGWVRFREPQGHSPAHLLALVDAWPPAVIGMFRQPAPSSSLTWNMEFIGDTDLPSDWWQYRADTDYAAEGYAFTEARLWRDDGTLVAISRQTVAAFG